MRLPEPLTFANGLLTANGRLRRERISKLRRLAHRCADRTGARPDDLHEFSDLADRIRPGAICSRFPSSRALAGDITRELYVAFLTQAYHHVRHTVPLLMAVGARLPERQPWLQKEILHYLEEEQGHDQWILDDIEAAGGDAAAAARARPTLRRTRWSRSRTTR